LAGGHRLDAASLPAFIDLLLLLLLLMLLLMLMLS
jgi:hypothetical protein